MATKGRPPSRVPLGLTKQEFNTVLHALKVSIDKVQMDDLHKTEDGNVHPSNYLELSEQMAVFVHIAQRYKRCFCEGR